VTVKRSNKHEIPHRSMVKGWWTRTVSSSLSEIAPGLVETSDSNTRGPAQENNNCVVPKREKKKRDTRKSRQESCRGGGSTRLFT